MHALFKQPCNPLANAQRLKQALALWEYGKPKYIAARQAHCCHKRLLQHIRQTNHPKFIPSNRGGFRKSQLTQ